jgi:hypothetical protein
MAGLVGEFSKAKGIQRRGSVVPAHVKCAHCQRKVNDFAGGHSRGLHGEHLCHPNAKNRPDCYALVVRYGHEMPCLSQICFEDHDDLMIYVEAHSNYNERVPF